MLEKCFPARDRDRRSTHPHSSDLSVPLYRVVRSGTVPTAPGRVALDRSTKLSYPTNQETTRAADGQAVDSVAGARLEDEYLFEGFGVTEAGADEV